MSLTKQQVVDRKLGIGGSDIASVLNQKPYGCARRLFYDKTDTKPDYEVPHNTLFDRGHVLEPEIIRRYEEETGLKVEPVETAVHPMIDWMRVNVDGIVVNPILGRGVFEAKSHGQYIFNRIKAEGLPVSHILQIHYGMMLHDCDWGAIGVLHPDTFQFITFEVERDESIVKIIEEEGAKFWEMKSNGVKPERLPPSDKRCSTCVFRTQCQGQALLDSFEDVDMDDIHDGSEHDELVNEWLDKREVLRVATMEEKELKTQVVDVMDAIPAMYSAGHRVVSKPQERVTCNSKKFKEDYPEIYSKYAKRSVSRPIRPFQVEGG